MKKQIGEKIRQIRVINNLSQDNIASELGISTGAYSNIERGKTDITVTRLYALAKIFKVSILELLSEQQVSIAAEPRGNYQTSNSNEYKDLKDQLNKLQKEMVSLKKKKSK